MSDKLFENITINIKEQLNNFKNEIQNIIETKIKSEIGTLLNKINDKFLNLSSNKKRNEEILQNFILQITENTEILKYLKDYTDKQLNINNQNKEINNIDNQKLDSEKKINNEIKDKNNEKGKNLELNNSNDNLKNNKENEILENNVHVYEGYDDIIDKEKKENKMNKETDASENNMNSDNIIDNNIPEMIFPESLLRNYNSFNYSIEYESKEIDDIYLSDLKESQAFISITIKNNGEIDWPENCYICCIEDQEKTGIYFDDMIINNGNIIKVGESYSDKIYLRTQENFTESDEYILSYEIKKNKKQSLNPSQTGMYLIKVKKYNKTINSNNNQYYKNKKKKNRNNKYKKKEKENNSYYQNGFSDTEFNNL